MDYHKRLDMVEMFKEPPEYKPPGTAEELACSVDYPNMNSLQYRMTRKATQNVLHPCLEHVARNGNGQIIVAGNDLMGRRWGSSFYGWESAEEVLDDSKVSFKRQCRYCITALQFTKDPNLVSRYCVCFFFVNICPDIGESNYFKATHCPAAIEPSKTLSYLSVYNWNR